MTKNELRKEQAKGGVKGLLVGLVLLLVAAGSVPLYQTILQSDMDGNGFSITNLLSVGISPSGTLTEVAGDLYWNGSQLAEGGSGSLIDVNNLSDVSDAETSRANLGLGTASTKDSEYFTPATDLADVLDGTTPFTLLNIDGNDVDVDVDGDLEYNDDKIITETLLNEINSGVSTNLVLNSSFDDGTDNWLAIDDFTIGSGSADYVTGDGGSFTQSVAGVVSGNRYRVILDAIFVTTSPALEALGIRVGGTLLPLFRSASGVTTNEIEAIESGDLRIEVYDSGDVLICTISSIEVYDITEEMVVSKDLGVKDSGKRLYTTAVSIENHIADTSAAHAASAVSFDPAGDIVATNSQAAIEELDTEKATAAQGALADTAAQLGNTNTWTAPQLTTRDQITTPPSNKEYVTREYTDSQQAFGQVLFMTTNMYAASWSPTNTTAIGLYDAPALSTQIAFNVVVGEYTATLINTNVIASGTPVAAPNTMHVHIEVDSGSPAGNYYVTFETETYYTYDLNATNLTLGDWVSSDSQTWVNGETAGKTFVTTWGTVMPTNAYYMVYRLKCIAKGSAISSVLLSTGESFVTFQGTGGSASAAAVQVIAVAASDETTALAVGTDAITFRMPYAMTLDEVRISVGTAPVGSVLTVDINESGSTILSTKLTIDASEKTSTTAATPAVISDAALADDAEITIDIDGVGPSTAGAGLKIYLIDNP